MGRIGLFIFAVYVGGFLLHFVFLQDVVYSLSALSAFGKSLVWPAIDFMGEEWQNFIIPLIAGLTATSYDKFVALQARR